MRKDCGRYEIFLTRAIIFFPRLDFQRAETGPIREGEWKATGGEWLLVEGSWAKKGIRQGAPTLHNMTS